MRTRLIGGFVVLLLLVPAAAFAVDTDVDLETICYVDPLDPRCVDVGDVDVEEPVDEEPVDEEPVEVIDEEEELDEAEVLGVTVERDAAVLAVTGADVGVIALLAAALLGAGALLLTLARRRGRHTAEG
jgi:hypothetical protein